ncbi:nuclease PIN [Salmonella enterica]|nr:nuclease PIN [Salmonella enterica]EGM2345280.1 nuclease PIN [Salmonella enterica]EGM2363796.1 nuclease PIN [Salmonella enterica]
MFRIIWYASILIFANYSLPAMATKYCNIFWANDNLPQAFLNVNVDGSSSGIYPLKLQAGGHSTAIRQYEEDMPSFSAVDGIYRYWLQYPDGWQITSQGLKYRIITDLEVAGSQSPGVKTVVTAPQYFTWRNILRCNRVGEKYNFSRAIIDGVKIEIDRGTAWPGIYSLKLPLKVAYEENKGRYSGQSGGGWPEYADAMKSFTPVNADNVTISITSKCELTSRALNINLGRTITPAEAKAGINKTAQVSVICNAPANILFSLKAVNMIDGIINKTKCGSGYCMLLFDNNNSKKKVAIPRGGYQVSFSVLFQDANAEVGDFEGAAVLTMDVL